MPAIEPQQPLDNSPFMARLVERHPQWLPELEQAGRLDSNSPPNGEELAKHIDTWGLNAGLRRFRNREMLRICWRELAATASLSETLTDLTRLAELCLQAALAYHQAELEARFGRPMDADGKAQQLVVFALGKLGGGELNLSSDIDLILAYPAAGHCSGRRKLANEQFFTRLARALIDHSARWP